MERDTAAPTLEIYWSRLCLRPYNTRPFLLWRNGWTAQDEACMQVGLGPGHIVLDGDLAPPPQCGTAPPFRSMSVVAKRLDGSRCHVRRYASAQATYVRWGSSYPRKGHGSHLLLAHVYCGQTVAHLSCCCAVVQTVAQNWVL